MLNYPQWNLYNSRSFEYVRDTNEWVKRTESFALEAEYSRPTLAFCSRRETFQFTHGLKITCFRWQETLGSFKLDWRALDPPALLSTWKTISYGSVTTDRERRLAPVGKRTKQTGTAPHGAAGVHRITQRLNGMRNRHRTDGKHKMGWNKNKLPCIKHFPH